MNIFLSLFSVYLWQGCSSLRFNEAAEANVEVDDNDEGRRRRRRRRRRRSSPVPGASFDQNNHYVDDFYTVSDWIHTKTSASRNLGVVGEFANGWLTLDNTASAPTGNDYNQITQSAWFNFNKNKVHGFGIRFAVTNIAKTNFFVGLSQGSYSYSPTLMGDGIGFNHAEATTTIKFHVQGASDNAGYTVQNKLVGGANVAMELSTPTTQSNTVASLPLKAITLGWTFLPNGQYGVVAVTNNVGIFRVYYNNVHVKDVAAVEAQCSIKPLAPFIGIQSTDSTKGTLLADWVVVDFGRSGGGLDLR